MIPLIQELTDPQLKVYKYLLENPGARSREVAEMLYPKRTLRQSEPCVSRVLTSLEDKKLIDSDNCPLVALDGTSLCQIDEKIERLDHCIHMGFDEDAIGHLFDLINHLAPGYKYGKFKNIKELQEYYGKDPKPILPPENIPF